MNINKIFDEVYEELRDYYDLDKEFKHYENFYNQEQINKGFSLEAHFKDYLLNGFNEDIRSLKLLTGDDELDHEYLSLMYNTQENIKDYEISQLKQIINSDYYEFYNIEYYDSYLSEEILYLFNMDENDFNKYTHYCQSYSGTLYLNLDIDRPDFKYHIENYDTEEIYIKQAIEEHIRDNYKAILYYCVYRWLFRGFSIDYKEITSEWVRVQELAREELKIKEKELKKEIEELEQELKVISPKAKIYKILENNIILKKLELE